MIFVVDYLFNYAGKVEPCMDLTEFFEIKPNLYHMGFTDISKIYILHFPIIPVIQENSGIVPPPKGTATAW